MKVIIEEYSLLWPEMFQQEKMRLQAILPTSTIVQHIGSTSVPGLVAKPVIDIMVGLDNFAEADSLVLAVQSLSYEYVAQFEIEMPYRRYFRKESAGLRTHHIHMVAIGSEFWHRHLAFRDYLRTHPDTAREYAALKRKLVTREWQCGNDYTDAKTAFIRSIEAKAL